MRRVSAAVVVGLVLAAHGARADKSPASAATRTAVGTVSSGQISRMERPSYSNVSDRAYASP